jgi:hypothetical protein
MNMFIWVRLTSGDEIFLNTDRIMSAERAADDDQTTVVRMTEKNHSGDFVVYIVDASIDVVYRELLHMGGN